MQVFRKKSVGLTLQSLVVMCSATHGVLTGESGCIAGESEKHTNKHDLNQNKINSSWCSRMSECIKRVVELVLACVDLFF